MVSQCTSPIIPSTGRRNLSWLSFPPHVSLGTISRTISRVRGTLRITSRYHDMVQIHVRGHSEKSCDGFVGPRRTNLGEAPLVRAAYITQPTWRQTTQGRLRSSIPHLKHEISQHRFPCARAISCNTSCGSCRTVRVCRNGLSPSAGLSH
jgi:hypothetical protein